MNDSNIMSWTDGYSFSSLSFYVQRIVGCAADSCSRVLSNRLSYTTFFSTFLQSKNQKHFAIALFLGVAPMKVKPTDRCRSKVDEKDGKESGKNVAPHSLPVQRSSQITRGRFKLEGLLIESISLVHQQFNLFATFQDLFNILHHDSLDIFDLRLDSSNIVQSHVSCIRIVKCHALTNDFGKFFIHAKSNGSLRLVVSEFEGKSILHVVQKGIGNTMFIEFVTHTEVANTIFNNVMKNMGIVDIRHLAILHRDFREQDSRHGREITCRLHERVQEYKYNVSHHNYILRF